MAPRSLKYERVYLKAYPNVAKVRQSIAVLISISTTSSAAQQSQAHPHVPAVAEELGVCP